MANDNENYFLPGPKQDNDKDVSAQMTQQLWRDFNMY